MHTTPTFIARACRHALRFFCFSLFLAAGLFSCAEEDDPAIIREQFTSIFDHPAYTSGSRPLDVVQTADDGYLVLAERDLPDATASGVYVLKANADGGFETGLDLESAYVNPTGPLLPRGEGYAFVAMDVRDQGAVIVEVGADATLTGISPITGFTYPAATASDGDAFLLLSYNHGDRTSVVSRHDFTGALVAGPRAFSIGAGDAVEEPVMEHFIRTGRRFPFQVGRAAGTYFFNGFINYTFSLVFTDLVAEDPSGVVHGQQDKGGFSAVQPLGGNTFALARFNFGDNYLLPRVDLQPNGLANATDLGGFRFPEMTPDAPVRILSAELAGRQVLIFATNTHSKQIGLFFYDPAGNSLLSSRYLGFSNPYEIGSLAQTRDGGLIVSATTWLAGRFPRICLFKISSEDVLKQVK